MSSDAVVGIIIGAIIGYAVTKVEHQSSETAHTVIGTIAGATIGLLAGHHVLKTGERRAVT